ncbi:MAG TPA: hypothetical protein VHM88_12255 [Candidatus Acidoferrales bacterium]|jgi:hypothetical protein|nr:hypothetical protein [Candidatus Acidoferrales bacterium]
MFLTWLAFLFLALSGGSQSKVEHRNQEEPQLYLEREAYEIYAVLLPEEWTWKYAKAESLVIQQETETYPDSPDQQECLPSGEEFLANFGDVLENYKKANASRKLLARGFPIEKPYDLVPRKEIMGLIAIKEGMHDWSAFYARYPRSRGYIQVSAVGFNSDKTTAIVYVGHSCGGLCGGGTYHLLEKIDGKWRRSKVKAVTCAWVS